MERYAIVYLAAGTVLPCYTAEGCAALLRTSQIPLARMHVRSLFSGYEWPADEWLDWHRRGRTL